MTVRVEQREGNRGGKGVHGTQVFEEGSHPTKLTILAGEMIKQLINL